MIGDSTAELDLMLADLGVPVKYGSAAVYGLFRRAGDIVEENGVQVVLTTCRIRVRDGVLGSALQVDTDITVNGTIYNVVEIATADIEGLQAIDIVPRGT